MPIPEANTRLAALRSGQVDWIEVPPADGIHSLKSAGYTITTGSYPHVWPWLYNIGATNSPFKDVKVRQALNYCIDRDGLVSLLNGTAEPSVGWLKPSDPDFGKPANHYKFDPAKGKALLAEAGYTAAKPLSFKVMISNSGSGQMLPLPMNEFLQQNLKEACGVDVAFDVVEWQVLLNAARATPDSPSLQGNMALNISSPSSDPGVMARYFSSANFSPNGFNFEQWKDEEFDAALEDDRDIDRSESGRRSLPQGARTAGRQSAVALHRARPQSACDEPEGQGLRLAAVVVRRSDPGEHAIGRYITGTA